MDVRQFAFLARQPSSALKSRESFWGLPKRGLALILANALFWQPLLAQADGIVVSAPGTTVGQAGNGVPVVNIATPNGSGLSHNQFKDYNVGANGVILNNGGGPTQNTQLGGIILGNPNLKGGSANIILNEVNGGSPSQLRGYTEVAGQSAKVIVANPYGISCSGCGFINTPNVTLTTGKPILDNGRLDRYQVDGGAVTIDGQGLNASNVDRFEIITRSAKINAQINARNLTVIAGRNDVNAQTLNATARADDGSAKPELAIDSSALGGMYAGAIRLVGTEAGVGVKLDGTLAASGGDIQLDANGHLSMAQAAASGAVNVKAASLDAQGPIYAGTALDVQTQGDLNSRKTLAARDSITLSSGGQLTNNGIIEAGVNADNTRNATGDASLTAQTLNNTGTSVIASRALTINAQALNNQGGTLSAKQSAKITAATLDNQNKGRVLSNASLDVKADRVLNAQGGLITSSGPLTATLGELNNRGGEVSSLDVAALNIATLDNVAGLVTAGNALSLTASGAVNNQGGTLSSQGTLALKAGAVDNSAVGRIASNQALTANVASLNNNGGRLTSVNGLNLDLNGGQLNNQAGLIRGPALVFNNLADVANQGGEISSTQGFTLAAQNLDNSGGNLLSDQGLTLRIAQALSNAKGLVSANGLDARAASLDNGNGMLSSLGALDLTVDGALQNQAGVVVADGNANLTAARLDNSNGQVSGKQNVNAYITDLANRNGLLITQGAMSLGGNSLDNRQNGLVSGAQGVQLSVASVDNRGGEVSSKAAVTLNGSRLDNSDSGRVIAGSALNLTVDDILNRNLGVLRGQTGVSLIAGHLDNTGGTVASQKDSALALRGDLQNAQGLISSEGLLSVTAASLANRLGSLSSAGQLSVTTTGAVDNQGGRLVTDSGLDLRSASLDNGQKGTLSARQAAQINTGTLDNHHGGGISSAETLGIIAGQLNNGDDGQISSAKALTASVSGLDQQGGQLTSSETLTLDLNRGQLNNQGGLINGPLLLLKNLKDVNNQGGEISSRQAFTFTADNLDNGNGKLLSNDALTLRISQALANVKGLIAAASVDSHAATLDNSGGTLTSRGDALLNVDGQLTNQNLGLINATNTLTINSAALDNQKGSLLGSAIALDFGNATGDLNNAGGLITTAGSLSLDHLRDLNNQGGEISSAQSLNLSGRSLDNSAGRLISNNLLVLKANNLINQGGLMSGWQGLSVSGASLDNRNNGTLSSRYGDLNATLTGSLLNSGAGALVSQKALTVTTTELDNSDKGILSSAGGQTLTISGLLNNAQGGVIDSGAALNLTAQNLDNSAGSITGGTAATLGLLATLTNTNGKLSSGGPLLITRAAQINNQGGQLASQGLLTLLTGGLDNRNRGTVAANERLTLTASGVVQNGSDGLIYSQNADLKLTANRLDNAKGAVQSQAGLTLDVAGDIDNQSGKLIAQAGDLSANAASLDNRGGVLSSLKGALQSRVVGVLRNGYDLNNNRQGGIVQGQTLNLLAGAVDNYGGRISAQSGNALVTTGNFDNRNGGLYAKGLVSVTGHDFDNSGDNDGQIAGQQIDLNLSGALNNRLGIIESESTLKVSAASLDNQTGRLRALGSSGTTEFAIGGLFDNRNGLLETANNDLILGAGSLQNAGGTVLHVGVGRFDIAPGNLNSVGGSLVTRGDLTVNQDTWTNSSVIQAGRLTVNVNQLDQTTGGQLLAAQRFIGTGGNWSTNGLIASDGSLDLTLSGALNSTGRISSLGNLNVSAAQLNLSNTASIAGGGITTANITGTLNNYGRLTSTTDLNLTAGAINNYATLGSGQNLTVTTGTLLNDHGLIFSGGDMGLRVDALNNSYADIYSMGNLSIDRDGKGGLASSIINSSSNIQSDGSLSLTASTIKNLRSVLTTNDGGIYTASITEFPCQEGPNYAGDCSGGKENHLWQVVQRDKFEVTDASAASSISAGKDLTITGGDLLNASSSIGTAGNLNITVNNLANNGIETGETETWRLFVSERTRDASGWYSAAAAFNNRYSSTGAAYNPKDLSGLEAAMASFIGMTEQERTALRRVTKIDSGDQRYAAVIQAAGAATVKAQGNIDNSVVRPGFNYVGAGAKTATDASGASAANGFSTRITINQQLPPDLAQQQINPLSLPGFSLPTGQGGLFRLSGEGTATPTNTGPQSWTLGGNNLATADRPQATPGTPVRTETGQGAANPLDPGQVAPVGGTGTSVNGLTINRVQGLPDSQFVSNPQKYLIETNPLLTNLQQFMGSDYLLSKLGYDPDQSQKRLGDGLYEQRLIQQAVIARTGQRFIDGQTSDASMFKYLMDNAIGTKQRLNLAVGVSLTAEQVAALTHDIVWMENATVAGQQVLVPVLYLAQANNRLAPNGALITGSDLSLMAGANLDNVGTLRATQNLAASAGRDMVNSGLIEAGNRLDLLAGNNLTNRAGGIIAGRDVSVAAVNGDVINERSITSHQSSSGYRTERTDFVDSAARIEAANTLSLGAGRDINSAGGVLKSGADTVIQAGRDVNLASAEQRNANAVTNLFHSDSVAQYGTVIEAGRDFQVVAARDISAIGSQIDAKRDLAMAATGNLTLASAANEQHSAGSTKKVKSQEDHVQQVSTTLKAGGDVTLSAGQDLALVASTVNAGDEAYLVAGKNLALKAAEDQDYSFYSKTKKTSSGKKFRLDEIDSTTNVGSLVSSGGNSTLVAGENLLLAGSAVTAEKGAAKLVAGKDVQILAVTDSDSARHERKESKSSWGGFKSSKVEDQVDEKRTTAVGSMVSGDTVTVVGGQDVKVTGSSLVSTGDLAVQAGRDLTIDAAQNTFSRTDMHKEKNRDLTGVLTGNKLGLDDITGNQHLFINSQKHNGTATETTLTGSTIGSSAGNVKLEAGRELKVVASDLVSTKDMDLKGSNVTIAAGMENASQTTVDKSKSLAVGRVIGGTVVDTARSIRDGVEAAKNADDPRLKAVKLAQIALNTYNLGGQMADANGQGSGFADKQGGTASNGSLIKIGTELANTSSKNTTEYRSETAKQSTLNAGQGLSIVATGKAAETQGDIHVIGSELKAANTTLIAKNDIILESAQNTTERKNDSNNNKTSIGASFNIGEQNGFTLDLGAQIAKGMGSGSSVTQVNTKLDTGALVMSSGQDTTLAGAQVRADSIKADIGGNLNIASRQDTDTQKSKQSSAGAGASICVPPFCYGTTVTASGSMSAGNMNSDYKAVTDQTGLYAGKDGYTLEVDKNTTLQGAVIASEASADKNLLITDRLLTSDIKNTSKINSTSASAGISGGSSGIAMGPPMGAVLSESDSSKTRAAVSEGTIVVRDPEGANDLVGLNRDTQNANKHLDKPDEKAMRERMDLINSSAQLAITIGSTIGKAKIDESEDPNSDAGKAARQKLLDSGISDPTTAQVRQQAERDYGVGSSFQRTTQTVTAIIQGIAGGNVGAAIAGAAAPYLAQQVKDLTAGDDNANLMAHAVLGAVLARAGGNSALVGAGGAVAAEATARLIRDQLYGNVSNDDLTSEQKQTISALSTLAAGIAGSAVGKDALSAVAAAQVGKNAVENNALSDIAEALAEGKTLEQKAEER
ncbi:hemagglutinin repeat-containing protein, partial [Pseudomonas fluorescens]|uniref:two-partner secretion domain-containing protein n=1 Tax=Pseudomonas fluorescens TaxID=294 RepID=UPI001BEC551C